MTRPTPEGAPEPRKCQRCRGVIENCNGNDCDGTGNWQPHWRAEGAEPPVSPDLRLQPKFDECHTAEPSLHELILRYYGHHFSPEETARYVLRYEAAFAATPPVPVVPAPEPNFRELLQWAHGVLNGGVEICPRSAIHKAITEALAARPAEQDTARDALQDAATELEEAARLAEPDYPATADRYRFTASRCRAAAEGSAR